MAQMTPGQQGERHPTVTELQQSLDAMKHEQEDLADEIRAADAESRNLPGGSRKLMGGPLEDPGDIHHKART